MKGEALAKERIAEVVKELHTEGYSYTQIFEMLLGEVNDWWFHIYGLIGWWFT